MLHQISVFLTNKPGILAELTKIIREKNINIRAMTVADTADFGILRIIVDKTSECIKLLEENKYLYSTTDVLGVDVPDKPGSLHKIAILLGENDINIEYLYSTILRDEAIIILRVNDTRRAKDVLLKNNFKLIDVLK